MDFGVEFKINTHNESMFNNNSVVYIGEDILENTTIPTFWSPQLHRLSEWYAQYHGYASLVVCLVGTISNIFNIIVLTQPNMQNSINQILTALAVSDLLTMLSYIPYAVHFHCLYGIKPTPLRNSYGWIQFLLFHVNFTVTTHTCSNWMGVLLGIFRYCHVKCTSTKYTVCSRGRVRLGIVFVYICTVVCLLPNYLTLEIKPLDTVENETMYIINTMEATSKNIKVLIVMNFWVHALLVKVFPCIAMSVFGVLLLCALRSTQRKGKRLRKANKSRNVSFRNRLRDHTRTTRMLIVVIILFLVTELPQGILVIISGLVPGFFEVVYTPLGDFMDIMALINNSINFTLYCTMSKLFRRTFIRLICGDKFNTWKSMLSFSRHASYYDGSIRNTTPLRETNQRRHVVTFP